MINEAWLMVEWRLALCRKSDDITIDLTRCSTSINYGERLRPLINTGKLYFHYFLVIFFLISSYVILLLSLHAGGTLLFIIHFSTNAITNVMTVLYNYQNCMGSWVYTYIHFTKQFQTHLLDNVKFNLALRN